jgi:hypothetical protein
MSKHKYDTKDNLRNKELTGRGITRALVRVKKKKEKADIRIGRIVQPMHSTLIPRGGEEGVRGVGEI